MKEYKPGVELEVYGDDLARNEQKVEELRQKRDEIAKKRSLWPPKKRKELNRVEKIIERESWQNISDKEKVLSDPYKSKMYGLEKKRIAQERREVELDKAKEKKRSLLKDKLRNFMQRGRDRTNDIGGR